MRRSVRIAILSLSLAALPALAASPIPASITAAIADAGRPDTDKARDANRKPAETLAFAGVRPGMTIAELAGGGGYYTRLLAKAVGPKGKVLAIVTAAQAARPNGLVAINGIVAAYPNVMIVNVADYASIALPEKADLFWTTENYHDFHNGPTANIAALNKAVFDNLKKGGAFYVEDHSAAPGAGLEATSKFHRMDEDLAKQELKAAGFKVATESDLLRNPNDDRAATNSESGHFLSDRFMIKAVK
jgi:predicted methyltransferase